MTSWRLPAALMILVLGVGIAVRLVGLGHAQFINDELNHVFAAQALEREGRPVLPEGRVYARGLDITRLVAMTTSFAEDPELAARIPSAFFGVVGLGLFASVAWSMAGPWPAVWATLLLGIYPEAILQSRQVRFYTYQLLFGLVAFYAVWRVVMHAGDRTTSRHQNWRQALWLLLALSAFYFAARVQLTTYSVVAGASVTIALAGAADLWRRGRRSWGSSVTLQATVLGIVVAVAVLIFWSGRLERMVANTQFNPTWAVATTHTLGYYYRLVARFPLLVSLLPLAALVALRRNLRLGIYLLVWFAVPFALHSFVFARMAERYVLLAMPALFLVAGMAAAAGCGALYRSLLAWSNDRGLSPRARAFGAAALVAVIALAAVVTQPAASLARKAPRGSLRGLPADWRGVGDLLRSRPALASLPLGASDELPALYYAGRIDFSVKRSALEREVLDSASMAIVGRWMPQGTLDVYAGVPALTTADAIRHHFVHTPAVLIAVDSVRWSTDGIESSLRTTLLREGTELCRGACGSMRLYRLPVVP